MKVNFSQLLALITIVIAVSAANSAYAQEGSPNNETPEINPFLTDPNTREEKSLIYEPEGKANSQKDQPVISPSTIKTKGKTSESSKTNTKTEEDALSFNFLYYIIQKFKISDIVDQ